MLGVGVGVGRGVVESFLVDASEGVSLLTLTVDSIKSGGGIHHCCASLLM